MALVVADRVQETTATTGTGTITLAGAVSGFQSFATIGDGNTTYYCVTSGTAWEVGIGTYTASGTTLARTTILASSAAGAAITLAGTSNVFCVYPASKAVYEDENGNVAITVNSTGDALRITQTGAGNALLVEDDTNPDSSPFVINASGSVGMGGTTVPAGTNFYNNKTLTGNTSPYSNRTVATVQTDATGTARGYTTSIGVVAAHPTLSGLQHFLATQASFNASTVTSQIGYYANTSLVGATNNYAFNADNLSATTGTAYGFYSNSNISGTGTAYNFYAAGTAPNVFTGTVNIGSNGSAGSNFLNAKTITGATVANANYTFATIQSDVTSQARGYLTNLGTAATAFTLSSLTHFYAFQGTIGAGSTVTTQYGFLSESNLIGATNNYGFAAADTATVTAGKTAFGFYSNVNTATGGGTAYGFYANGTAPNVFVGTVNIGALPVAGTNFYNAKNITGATTAYACAVAAVVQSDVTVVARGYSSLIATAAAAFSPAIQHFYASQSSIGAGSTVTAQYGFFSESNLIGATNNYGFIAANTAAVTAGKTAYGFYSAVNTATGGGTAYGVYSAGTAPNVFIGTVNIGSNGAAGSNFYNAKTITGAVTANANVTVATVQSDVTSAARGYATVMATAAASFSTTIQHFYANQSTIGAGSTVTAQYGFFSESNLIGATNNYGFFANNTAAVTAGKTAFGFYSSVNTATGGGTTYSFYSAGTAPNVFTGTVNIGSNGAAGINFYNAKNITGATTAYANHTVSTVQSDVTANATGCSTFIGTAAAAFTLSNLQHFLAQQGTIGAGSTVTAQYGFSSAGTLIGATNNYGFVAGDTAAVTAGKTAYGFYSSVNTASGGGTTYAFYSAGTAPNVFTGNVSIGTTGSSAKVTVRSDSSGAVSDVMLLQNPFGSTINTGVALYFDPNGSGTSRAASVQSVQSTSGNYADLRFFTANATTPAERMRISATGNVGVSQTNPTSNLDVNGSIAFRAPSLTNAATYTVATTDVSLRFTTTACTVTLPAAASFTGRVLYLNNVTAIAVTSASSNVIPLGSNTAGTAILAATAGKFAMIQSDGSNWITMMAN